VPVAVDLGKVERMIREAEAKTGMRVALPARTTIYQMFISLATEQAGFPIEMTDDVRHHTLSTAFENFDGFLLRIAENSRDAARKGGYAGDDIGFPVVVSEIAAWASMLNPFDSAPAMAVEESCTPAERRRLWDHIGAVWSEYGRTEPYWSVLTHDRWLASNIANEQMLFDFYASGELEARRLDAWLQRNALAYDASAVCAEYGCGVGRVTRSLAARFGRVIAFDISAPHLDTARRFLSGQGIDNVDYVLVRNESDLQPLADVDVFYSVLVLQHNPPPIMTDILGRAFSGLKPDGSAFFQVPTHFRDYAFSLADYWNGIAKARAMEMHCLPQRSILELGRSHNVFPLEIQPDSFTGNPRWTSNTFLMTKMI
jgi:SAM-dependent methyltransferase